MIRNLCMIDVLLGCEMDSMLCLGRFVVPFRIFKIPGRHKGQGGSDRPEVPKSCVRRLLSFDDTKGMSFSLKSISSESVFRIYSLSREFP